MATAFHQQLDARRRELGMSVGALAERSGVSRATIERILAGRHSGARVEHLRAIASALGTQVVLGEDLTLHPIKSVLAMRQEAARAKAHYLAAYLQGTSALEAQAVSEKVVSDVEENLYCKLMAGPASKLWAA